MKFDVIVGNPPYQVKVGPKKTEPIWNKFVKKSFDLCKEDGYVSLIHPSGWRSPKGKFKDIQDLIVSKNLIFLSMNNFNEGSKIFGVGTNFDYYIVQKTKNYEKTIINDVNDKTLTIDLREFKFIPSGLFNQFKNIIAKEGEENVELLYSYSDYETRKSWMSKTKCDEYKYPAVYTITQKSGITCYYSNTNKNGHFGVCKVIWSNGLGTYPIIDKEGLYGLTQFSYAIVDTIDNLQKIKKAMETEKFLELMRYVKFTNNKYDYKVISTFKKDFWKEFIDD